MFFVYVVWLFSAKVSISNASGVKLPLKYLILNKKKMKRLQILQKLVHEVAVVNKFYAHESAAINLSKIYFLKKHKQNM